MNRIRYHQIFPILFACAALAAARPAAAQGTAAQGAGRAAPQGAMSVQVFRSPLRSAPSALSPVLAMLDYRTSVILLEKRQGWAYVQVSGTGERGFVYLTALGVRENPAGGAGSGAGRAPEAEPGVTAPELTLAGKGFRDSDERGYRNATHADYSWVDFMEGYALDPGTSLEFLAGKPGR